MIFNISPLWVGQICTFLEIFFSFFCVLRAITARRAHCAPPKANRVKDVPFWLLMFPGIDNFIHLFHDNLLDTFGLCFLVPIISFIYFSDNLLATFG